MTDAQEMLMELVKDYRSRDIVFFTGEDVLGISIISSLDKTYQSCVIVLAVGNPNVVLDTRLNALIGAFGTERVCLSMDEVGVKLCRDIDNYYREIWEQA